MNLRAVKATAKNKLTMGPVKQQSGGLVYIPFYSDNRRLCSHPELIKVVGEEFGKIIQNLQKKGLKVDCVAGVPNIGIPLTWAVSLAIGLKAVYIEKKRKKFLHRTFVQGDFRPGEQAVLIDDVMGAGATKDLMIENARRDGLTIKHVIVLANAWPAKNQAIIKQWAKNGIGFSYLFTRDELMQELLKTGRITKEALEVHKAYAENPADWIKNKKIWRKFLKWKKSTRVKTGETF